MPLRILRDDRYLVVAGEANGINGNFVREDGQIRAINVGGRIATRV